MTLFERDEGPARVKLVVAYDGTGFHGWAEPAQRLRVAADHAGVRIAVPRPGGRVDVDPTPSSPTGSPTVTDWWSAVG